MFKWLLENSLTNRLLVLIAAAVLMAYGAFTLSRTPVDVFPDLNKPTVTLMTEAGGMAAEEVEQLITFPLETTMIGLPGVESVRSTSSAGLATRDALVAPVSGVIASANAVAGQVVDARELVFEVVDPSRLRIEALAYDPAQSQSVAGATLAVGGQRVPLRFLGAARSLRDQALPLQFAGDSSALGALAHLAIGQPVRVFVQSTDKVDGLQVPAAALLRNPANQTIVWVKESPERFAPRVVTAVPLDGTSVAVTSGLKPGDRVATQGATLINQVR